MSPLTDCRHLLAKLAITFVAVGASACAEQEPPVGTPSPPDASVHEDATALGRDSGGILDDAGIDSDAGLDLDAGSFDADGVAAEDAAPVEDAGSFDCASCEAQSSNRACVAAGTACGCEHDRHCSGAERCDLAAQRCVVCDGTDCWRSSLYPADWTPQTTDAEGRFLHDFSYAGYGAGVASIPAPSGPLFDVTAYGSGPDWTAAIQLAIDDASLAGGVVYFPPGSYQVDGTLSVQGSDVILRGAGAGATKLYFSTSAAMTDQAHLRLGSTPSYEGEQLLTADASSRADVVEVADASSFAPGDSVAVGWVITDAFRADHDMLGYWGFAAGQWRAFFRRTVLSIDTSTPSAHRVFLDVPLRYPALVRDLASLRRIEGLIRDVGVEDLSISNAVDQNAALAENRVSLIALSGVENGWVRRVESFSSPLSGPSPNVFHVQSHGISVINSRQISIEDLSLGRAQNRGSGGNGYLIELSRSNEVLIQRATLRDGRHNFSFNWDFGNSGIVIRSSDSSGSTCDGALVTCRNEFHHSLAMAVLVEDSRIADGWVGGNRRDESSGAGQTVTESVYWRLFGGDHIYSWQHGNGYLIGNDIVDQYTQVADTSVAGWEIYWLSFWALNSNSHTSLGTEPEDFVEGPIRRDTLVPTSLYLDQLERRLAD